MGSSRVVRCCVNIISAYIILITGVSGDSNEFGECQLPASLQDTWRALDSGQSLHFNSTGVSSAPGRWPLSITSFRCQQESGNKYMFGTTLLDGGETIDVYFCWELVRSTDVTWLMYELTPPSARPDFNSIRVYSTPPGAPPAPPPSMDRVCALSDDTAAPTLLYADSLSGDVTSVSQAAVQCPTPLRATFSYVRDGVGCKDAETSLDFCHDEDKSTARVDLNKCSTKVLFSDGGVLSCTASFTFNSSIYTWLVNHDSSVDSSLFHRFVCLKVKEAAVGIGTLQLAGVYAGDCLSPSASHTLTLTEGKSCREKKERNTMAIIVAVVVVVDLVAIALGLGCIYYFVRKNRNKRRMAYITKSHGGGSRSEDDAPPAAEDLEGRPRPRPRAFVPPLPSSGKLPSLAVLPALPPIPKKDLHSGDSEEQSYPPKENDLVVEAL